MIAHAIEQYARFAGELRTTNVALREFSQQDSLAGLANRRRFDAELDEAFQRAKGPGVDLALLLIDIDHFKQFKDRFGHLVGDQCLRHAALTMKSFRSQLQPCRVLWRRGVRHHPAGHVVRRCT
jgi:GGDEF domain-containing protein